MAAVPDGVHVDVKVARDAMEAVRMTGESLVATWSGADAVVSDLGGQLGGGPLGAAFMAGYRPAVARTADFAARCCPLPGRLSEAGLHSLAEYEAADLVAREYFSSLPTG